MFPPLSFFRKGRASVLLIPVFLVLCLCLGAGLFTGCDTGATPPLEIPGNIAPLVGYWDSGTGDGYIITAATLEYYGYTDARFTSKVREVINFDASSGVIIVEYTTTPIGVGYVPTDNFLGIYYRNLTANSVKLANSYTVANWLTPVETATLDQALAKFTLANVDLFVNNWNFAGQIRQSPPVINAGSLKGVWKENTVGSYYFDYVTITDNTLGVFIGYPSSTAPDDSRQITGDIVKITDTTAAQGLIYIRITFVPNGGDYEYYPVGYYYAIHWKNKTGDGIKFYTAYYDGSAGDTAASLAAAEAKYGTASNPSSTYFDGSDYGTFTRQ
jgi:hypothetical protein